MIEPTTVKSDLRNGLLAVRARCDTPSCNRTTLIGPKTEEQAHSISEGCVPPPWAAAILKHRKWQIRRAIGTYCPEHQLIIPDDAIFDDRTPSQKRADTRAAKKKALNDKAEKTARRRAADRRRNTKRYHERKRASND